MATDETTGIWGRDPSTTIDCPIHGETDVMRWYGPTGDVPRWETPPLCFRCYAEAMTETTRAYTASMLGAMRDPIKSERGEP